MEGQDISLLLEAVQKDPGWRCLVEMHRAANVFELLGIAGQELPHIRVLAWLLNRREWHGLCHRPLQMFLQLLAATRPAAEWSGALSRYSSEFELRRCKLEEPCYGTVAHGANDPGMQRIPWFAEIEISENGIADETLLLAMENEISAPECATKTEVYWAELQSRAKSGTYPVGVLLTPRRDVDCASEHFVRISYQDLLENVLEPCAGLASNFNPDAALFLTHYIRSLQYAAGRAPRTMAVTPKVKSLVRQCWEAHKAVLPRVVRESSDVAEKFRASSGPLLQTMFRVLEDALDHESAEWKLVRELSGYLGALALITGLHVQVKRSDAFDEWTAAGNDRSFQLNFRPIECFFERTRRNRPQRLLRSLEFHSGTEADRKPYLELRFVGGGPEAATEADMGPMISSLRSAIRNFVASLQGRMLTGLDLCRWEFDNHSPTEAQAAQCMRIMQTLAPVISIWFRANVI